MNVYIVEAADFEYDDYDSVVVVADCEECAVGIASEASDHYGFGKYFRDGQYPLSAKKIDLSEEGIIHSSFNAG